MEIVFFILLYYWLHLDEKSSRREGDGMGG